MNFQPLYKLSTNFVYNRQKIPQKQLKTNNNLLIYKKVNGFCYYKEPINLEFTIKKKRIFYSQKRIDIYLRSRYINYLVSCCVAYLHIYFNQFLSDLFNSLLLDCSTIVLINNRYFYKLSI